ncbi:MAG: GDSL-type esterase/lipase family protein [Spirochaetia bacterium]|nr:GDSL-type esterase/lipase family protein [Spirochaetia bacterium]
MLLNPDTQPKIIAIGDSVTKGHPDDYSWTKVASDKLGIPIENMGVSGDTYAGILLRIDEVIKKEPDLCIVSAGTNDIFLGYSVDDIKQTIKILITRLETEGIIPVISTPIPTIDEYSEKKLSELRSWIMAVCPHTIHFHAAFESESLLSGTMLSDGVHPTHEGHNRIAEICAHGLRKIFLQLHQL